MNIKYTYMFAAVKREKNIGILCKAARVSPTTFHNARFRRDRVGKNPAMRIYGALNAYGYLPSGASFDEMFPRHASEETSDAIRSAKPFVSEHSLAALWLKWKTSPLIIRDLYETGSQKTREQAKIYLENMPLAPRGTADTIDMRKLARGWVEGRETSL